MSPPLAGALAAVATVAALRALAGCVVDRYAVLSRRRLTPHGSRDGEHPAAGRPLAALTARARSAVVRATGRGPGMEGALAAWLDAISRSLRSGAGLATALAEAAPSTEGTPLEEVAGALAVRIDDGEGAVEALAAMDGSAGDPGVSLACRSLRLVARAGGGPAELVEGVAATVRDRAAQRAEAWALSTQARWSAGLIAGAPLAFGLLVAATDPRATGFLAGSPAGLACLVLGLLLDAAGVAWMVRIFRRGTALPALVAGLPDVVDLYGVAIRAGLTVALATEHVAGEVGEPFAAALGQVRRAVATGARWADELEGLGSLGPEVRPLAGALAASERFGSPLADQLVLLSADARGVRRRAAEGAARRLPVKLLFPLVLCMLPAFALITVVPLLVGALGSLNLNV